MAADFFEATQETVRGLNQTERQLFDYVVKNMEEVRFMSIQKFAAEQFLSTTTIFRFTQKLGFTGYADFINSLMVTAHSQQETELPDVVVGRGYSEEYLKNAMEAVRVMSPKRVDEVVELLSRKPNIYILTDDNTHAIGQYCERLFIGLGFHAYFPEAVYQMQNLVNRISGKDMILALSYSGRDATLIDFIERVYLTARPHLLSITRADNNTLENLSDTNFYVFADEVRVGSMDITSGVTMLMLVELLVYEYIARSSN
ncbi:MAG: MurR/RpiR family transcriptional regulator [Defluviitaleaceae bacterium]|nr:MurR/RpiR family transcriptional regulator [Defluviitaleaceae bacterium]